MQPLNFSSFLQITGDLQNIAAEIGLAKHLERIQMAVSVEGFTVVMETCTVTFCCFTTRGVIMSVLF